MSKYTLEQIKAGLEKNNGRAVNDHNVGGTHKIDYIAEYGDDNKMEIVAMFDNGHFSTNPLYISEEDGLVHLSTWSVGPICFGTGKGDEKEVMEKAHSEQTFKSRSFHNFVRIAA